MIVIIKNYEQCRNNRSKRIQMMETKREKLTKIISELKNQIVSHFQNENTKELRLFEDHIESKMEEVKNFEAKEKQDFLNLFARIKAARNLTDRNVDEDEKIIKLKLQYEQRLRDRAERIQQYKMEGEEKYREFCMNSNETLGNFFAKSHEEMDEFDDHCEATLQKLKDADKKEDDMFENHISQMTKKLING